MREESLDLIEFSEAIEYIKETEEPTKDETDELIRLIVVVAKIEGRTPGDLAQKIAHSIRDGVGLEPWITYLTEKEKIQKEKDETMDKPKTEPYRRRLVYVAHPFTGAEKRNIQKATQIIERLQHFNPSETFISPLLTFGYLDGQIDYKQAMDLCLSLLDRCDLLLLTGTWWQSNGCKIERDHAAQKGIKVIDTTTPKPFNFSPPSRKDIEGLIF